MSAPVQPVGQPGQQAAPQQAPQQQQQWGGAPPAMPPQQQQPPAPAQVQDTPSYSFAPPPPPPAQQQQGAPGSMAQQLQQRQQQAAPAPQPGITPDMLGQKIAPGPGIPPELVGRTYGEAMNIYAVMRQEFLDRQQGRPGVQQQQPAPQQQQQQLPPTQQQQGSNFWLDPEASIARIVDSRVEKLQAPQRVAQVQQQALAGKPHVQELQQGIAGYVQGLDDQALANPATWEMAYKLAFADAVQAGRLTPGAQNPTPMPMPQQQMYPVQQNGGWQPYSPAGQFFTEQPLGGGGAPQQAYGAASQPGPHNNWGLTPKQIETAGKMNMSLEDYYVWSGGYRPQGG